MEVAVNYVALLAASIASMAVGFAWYSPMMFGTQWSKLKGYTPKSLKEAQSQMGPLYAVSYVASLLMAFVLSHVMTLSISFYGYSAVQTGLTSAFWMWLGFAFPVQLTHQIFGEKNWSLLAIDTGYQLASLLAMGVVLGMLA